MAEEWVRPAAPGDAAGIARVQAAASRRVYGRLLPRETLADIDAPDAVEHWAASIAEPPSERHRSLVAVAASDVVGFSAFGPSDDPDLDATTDAELFVLCVHPDGWGRGHGSRLLNATMEHIADDNFVRVHAWLPVVDDEPLLAFLRSSGWELDGAHRTLDLSGDGQLTVDQHRLHVGITPEPV